MYRCLALVILENMWHVSFTFRTFHPRNPIIYDIGWTSEPVCIAWPIEGLSEHACHLSYILLIKVTQLSQFYVIVSNIDEYCLSAAHPALLRDPCFVSPNLTNIQSVWMLFGMMALSEWEALFGRTNEPTDTMILNDLSYREVSSVSVRSSPIWMFFT